jgi:hypothetical protein
MNNLSQEKLHQIGVKLFALSIVMALLIILINALWPSRDIDGNDWGSLAILISLLFYVPAMILVLVTLILGRLKNKVGNFSSRVSILGSALLNIAVAYVLIIFIMGIFSK